MDCYSVIFECFAEIQHIMLLNKQLIRYGPVYADEAEMMDILFGKKKREPFPVR